MTQQQPIGDLLKDLRDESTTLFRQELTLAKKEMGEKVSETVRNVTYLATGAFVAFLGLVLLLFSASTAVAHLFIDRGMDEGKAAALGFLIIGVVVGIIGAILIMKALKTLKHQSYVPERTIDSLKADKQLAKSQIS
jgi:uncharacterized BrkB/YihY/UPF0761 family membrane protein